MPPHIHHTETAQDNRIILFKGLKLENQHTRMTLGTLSWVYKPSDYLMVIGPGSPCWLYESQDLWPTKTERRWDAHSSTEMRFVWWLLWLGSAHFRLSDRYFLNMVRLNDHTRNWGTHQNTALCLFLHSGHASGKRISHSEYGIAIDRAAGQV